MEDNNGTPRIDGVKLTPETTAVHIKNIHDKLDELTSNYVTKAEFSPVKSIVYGLVGLLMIGVISGVLATVIRTSTSAVAGP